MPDAAPLEHILVGSHEELREIALRRRHGRAPGLFWLGGYRSVMTGAKAGALDVFAAENGLAMTRFDYSGHGESGGDFAAGTISRWLDEALAVFATTQGPQIVVGSSMGGWLALLMNRALRLAGSERVAALILIAPAVDMTMMIQERLTAAERRLLAREGVVLRPSRYGDGPYPYTRALIEDGEKHLLLASGHGLETGCPVTILQGARDPDVPQEHALRVARHILTDALEVTLVPDGDHRLSRPEDLAVLTGAVQRALEDLLPPQGELEL